MANARYRDLRAFVSELENQGELLRIKAKVDWNEEIGAVSRRLCDRETEGTNAPAVMFENIKGYPGSRFFTNTLGSYRRYALVLGLKKETPVKEIIETFRQRIKNPIKPKIVKSGPCKENILMGKDIDLLKFPTPKWHPYDGHRYIGTFHTVICKDPDSGWVNWGLYRMGIHDKRSTGITISAGQHIGEIYNKYEARNQPMPVAVAIGQDPINTVVAASNFMGGTSEVDMAGGLRLAPVELVKAETSDLLVPAHAEIILEGEVPPKERKMEGPFGEYTGYYGGDRFPKSVFHVKCITHRNDPILTGSQEGVALIDDNVMGCISQSALAKWVLLDLLAVPGVKDVFFAPYCATWMLCIVSATNAHSGISRRITSAIWGSKVGGYGGYADWVIIVDDDIDPTNIQQVLWSVVTRCDPVRGVQITPRRGTSMLTPKIPLLDRTQKGMQGSGIMIDAQFPYEWRKSDPASVPRVVNWESWGPKVREKALKILGEK